MQRSVVALVLLIAGLSGASTAQPAFLLQEETAFTGCGIAMPAKSTIEDIVTEFQTAIKRRDREQFLSLFLDPNRTSWQAVNGDKVLETKRKTDPGVLKAKTNPDATPASFIETVSSRAAASEEDFDNIRISGDTDVAAVSLDYRFKLDGKVRNTGTEHWLLVRTEQGWRITSVNWSIGTYTP